MSELVVSERGYTATARFLHWLTAVLVIIMIPIGIAMANFDFGPAQDTLYHLHRSIGALLLPIMIIRLLYRLTSPPPPLPADIPEIQRLAANTVHWLLYIMIIVQALVGWVATSAYRAPILVFWLFELPPIWPEDRAFSERAFVLHRFLGIAIVFVASGHIAAALYHHFVRKDRVLLRMTTG